MLSIEEASLSKWEEGDERKLGKAPVWEDYDSRCLPIPTRLQGDHSFQTPEKLKSKEKGDTRKTVSEEDIAASPLLSYVTVSGSGEKDDTLVLYLANDFHWRGATFVNVSGAGLATLKFKCKEKEVQLSRCVFVNPLNLKTE